MKVLMSAYACEPGAGSEPGTGWAWAIAAAKNHEVWLLTRSNNAEYIDRVLGESPEMRLRPVYIDLSPRLTAWKRGQRGVRLYYVLWQRRARKVAQTLHAQERFDVAHHITFAVDWLPAGVVGIEGLPAVWGPVGGAAPFPWAVRRELGAKGLAFEVARTVSGGIGRRFFGDRIAARAGVVVAQNDDVAKRFARYRPIIEPHVAIDRSTLPARGLGGAQLGEPTAPVDLVFVGRLIPWKGVAIAIRALTHLHDPSRRLTVVGTGPDRPRLERLAGKLGVLDSVEFIGQLPRPETLTLVASANAFVFPSLHDSGGWALAEAIALGVPVVVLDVGGASVQARRAGGAIVSLGQDTAVRFANAINQIPAKMDNTVVNANRLLPLLNSWYQHAGSSN